MKKGLIITISLGVLLLVSILCGFSKHETKIESYSTEFSTYVLAEYSETGIDGDGDVYTDFWDEQVSVNWTVSTVEDSIVEYNCPAEHIPILE